MQGGAVTVWDVRASGCMWEWCLREVCVNV